MNADSRLGAKTILIALAWIVVVLYVVIGQLPAAAVELPGQRSVAQQARLVAPQGWAFFTKSARDPREVAWQRSASGVWQSAMLGPHAEPRNLWGLDRRSRAQAVDLGVVLSTISEDQWTACESGAVPACLDAAGAAVPVLNPAPEPLLCGEVGVSKQKPLPWAWAKAADTTRIPASVVRLEVAC